MNKKGFTLVELIAVIAILAIATGLIATRFLGLIKDTQKFDDKSVAKGIAEAAYVYIDDKDNTGLPATDSNKVELDDGTHSKCYSAEILLETGFISKDQGLLQECDTSCINSFMFRVYKTTDQEKKVDVYKGTSCDNSNYLETY